MKRPSNLDEKPKEILYFVTIELVVAFLGILLAIIALLAEPSSELQGITPPMNVLLTLLDLFGGITLGTVLGLLQPLLIQDPALFLLSNSVLALLFGGLNLLIAWLLLTLKPRAYSSVLFLATINISCGLLGMPVESLHLPIGIGGFMVNFAMIHVFMGSRTRELFGAKPIHHIHLAATSQFFAGISFLVIGPYPLLMGQDPISSAQNGVIIFGCISGIASILVTLSLWTLRNGSYFQSITLALINMAVGMLQWPYGALSLALCFFILYYLLQPSIQEEFQVTKKLDTLLIQVLAAICGFFSILAGVSSAIAGYMDQSGAPIIGGTLVVLTGLAILWIAWKIRKYGVRSPRLTRAIILATAATNLIELGLDSYYEIPKEFLGSIEKGFIVIVLVACTALYGLSSLSGSENLLEVGKERSIWFSLFISIAILLRIVHILHPTADIVSFSVETAIWMGLFGILALSLNIEAGQTGLMNFGKVAFFLIGAYTTAILSRPKEPTMGLNPGLALPFVVCMVLSILLAAFAGFLISIPTLRLRADYLAIVTITAGEILRIFIRDTNLRPTFGSTYGLDVTKPFIGFFNWCVNRLADGSTELGILYYRILLYFPLVYGCLLACYLLSQRILNSPFGRVLRSIREDELAAQALGKNLFQFKTKAFIIGSGIAGLAGSLMAGYVTFVAQTNFLPLVTFSIWIMIVIGGIGNNRGVIFGAILIQYFRRFTRFDMPSYAFFGFTAENFRFIVIGLLLVIFIMFREEGIFKEEPIRTVATDIGTLKEKR